VNNYDGTSLPLSSMSPSELGNILTRITDYTKDVAASAIATDIVEDDRLSDGTAGHRDVAVDKIKPSGEFEILTTVNTGQPVTTFAAQGSTSFYTRTVQTGNFLDAMLGVSRTTDLTTLLQPAGQTLLKVAAP
jgi:hypothetical protein